MSELTGIFARGVFLGYKEAEDRYTDAQGQLQIKKVHLLGIERELTGQFGESRKTTLVLHIPAEKMKDSEFMSTLRMAQGRMIEVGLSGYTDYSKSRRPFVSNDAVCLILDNVALPLKAAS